MPKSVKPGWFVDNVSNIFSRFATFLSTSILGYIYIYILYNYIYIPYGNQTSQFKKKKHTFIEFDEFPRNLIIYRCLKDFKGDLGYRKCLPNIMDGYTFQFAQLFPQIFVPVLDD